VALKNFQAPNNYSNKFLGAKNSSFEVDILILFLDSNSLFIKKRSEKSKGCNFVSLPIKYVTGIDLSRDVKRFIKMAKNLTTKVINKSQKYLVKSLVCPNFCFAQLDVQSFFASSRLTLKIGIA